MIFITNERIDTEMSSTIEEYLKTEKIAFVVKFNEEDYKIFLGDRIDSDEIKQDWANKVMRSAAAINNKKFDRFEKKCLVCDLIFVSSKKSKFCSNKCRQKNKYNKSKGLPFF
jgi:hypothetical protein